MSDIVLLAEDINEDKTASFPSVSIQYQKGSK